MLLRFAKMHSLGNDFMIADLITQGAEPSPGLIRTWSDRHTGVGFDQFLAVLPPKQPDADFHYRIFNADGTEAEQCGNGARCFARFVVNQRLTAKRQLTIETAAGLMHSRLLDNEQVEVAMGVPSIEPAAVPFIAEAPALAYPLKLAGDCLEVTPVSTGNPHAVVFVNDVANADVEGVGAALQCHKRFPERANVGFLEVVDEHFGRLRVYERGTGETRACGSGAVAAMVAARLHKRFAEHARIALPGGELRLLWQGPGAIAMLSGPAQLIYTGRIKL